VELREYWRVVIDRLPIIVATFAVAVVVAALSVFVLPQGSSAYAAELGLAVRPKPLPATANPMYSQDYYDYIASEYANDDLIAIMQSDDFLKDVQAVLAKSPGGVAGGGIDAKKAHRVVTITTTSSTADGALRLAQGVDNLLTDPAAQSKYFDLFTNRDLAVSVVDQPRIVAQPAGRNALLNLVARSLVGLAMGIVLAFLVEYLDDTVRSEDAAILGIPVLAEIPGPGVPRAPKDRYRVSTASRSAALGPAKETSWQPTSTRSS
jgi:capsular polysaccharide biosynthesis protein